MRGGYLLGPLLLAPALGALFFIPQPGAGGAGRFDRASLALLVCHSVDAATVTFIGGAAAEPSRQDETGLRVSLP